MARDGFWRCGRAWWLPILFAVKPAPPVSFPPDHLAMMERGVSAIVASASRTLVPSVMRAVGYRLAPGATEITVYLTRSHSRQLLQDVADTGRVTVVFSEPSSHCTVQVKSSCARVVPAGDDAAAVTQRYRVAMEHELDRVGFPREFAQAMLAHEPDDVVAIHLVPEVAFDQTPGPRAGMTLGAEQPRA